MGETGEQGKRGMRSAPGAVIGRVFAMEAEPRSGSFGGRSGRRAMRQPVDGAENACDQGSGTRHPRGRSVHGQREQQGEDRGPCG